jgi:GrpB-like predicted nucleotidyltransferase (UPF0157 family)/GNAT superfamily N-acetyltransferase
MNPVVKKIEITPYNPEWPKIFEDEAALIRGALGPNLIAIHHIGSTSIPGLSAKPRIDIILAAKDPVSTISALEAIGYEYRGEWNIPFKLGFRKRNGVEVNLHVFGDGNSEIECNLMFRDYLSSHPEAVKEYAALKSALLIQESSHEKKNAYATGYNLGKDDFIGNVLKKSGYDGIRMHHCVHYNELEKAKHFRQKYFFGRHNIQDPYLWTFEHPNHVHLILHKGVEIVGYAHLQKWPEARAAMRIIVIDEPFRNKGLGAHFLSLCEKWLKSQGFHILQIESNPEAIAFYRQHGYVDMPFNDPDGHQGGPEDIPLGKPL